MHDPEREPLVIAGSARKFEAAIVAPDPVATVPIDPIHARISAGVWKYFQF